jgi:hypothetical protein
MRCLLLRIPRSLNIDSRDKKGHTVSASTTFTSAAGTGFTKCSDSTKDSTDLSRASSSMDWSYSGVVRPRGMSCRTE